MLYLVLFKRLVLILQNDVLEHEADSSFYAKKTRGSKNPSGKKSIIDNFLIDRWI